MRIVSVDEGSPAQRIGVRAGETLVAINGNSIRDVLDYHFHAADGDLEILVSSSPAATRTLEVRLDPGQALGLQLEELKIRLCGNNCIFCFVDQNPKGMRPSLYLKDEDYRLSFLHGNFVTLTNMKKWEIERIVEQRLTPLYVSVHSTNPETRRRLLRPRAERDILALIDYLTQSGIEIHTQIVLCPGYNDGDDLEATIGDLAARWPGVRSLAIVPLGLTAHREGLPQLRGVTPEIASRLLEQAERHEERFRSRFDAGFVYLADEIYRLLGREVPPAARYDGFPQLENGIGMTRDFLDRLRRRRRLFPTAARSGERAFTLVTGELFAPILEPAVRAAVERTSERVEIRIVPCANHFFGRSVTVAGLLTGSDIARSLEGRELGDRVLLPPATLNDDGLFLDDMPIAALAERFGVPFQTGLSTR